MNVFNELLLLLNIVAELSCTQLSIDFESLPSYSRFGMHPLVRGVHALTGCVNAPELLCASVVYGEYPFTKTKVHSSIQ